MNTTASRLLAPAILVVLVAGIVSSAIVGNDSDRDADAAVRTTTTVEERDRDDDDDAATTSTTRPRSTTSTTAAGATTTTRPGATAATSPAVTAAPAPTTPAPEPAPPAPPAAPAEADLVVHSSKQGDVIRFSVENAGPGSAPGITLVLSGAPGPVVDRGSGVECSGEGTITCTVASSGVGGIIGYVDLRVDGSCPLVTASASSSVPDPDPSSNTRTRNLC